MPVQDNSRKTVAVVDGKVVGAVLLSVMLPMAGIISSIL